MTEAVDDWQAVGGAQAPAAPKDDWQTVGPAPEPPAIDPVPYSPAFAARLQRGQDVANGMGDKADGPSFVGRAAQSLHTLWSAAKEGFAAGADAEGLAAQWEKQRAQLWQTPDYFGGWKAMETAVEGMQATFSMMNGVIMGAGAAAGQAAAMATGGNDAEQARARRDGAQMFMMGAIVSGAGERAPLMPIRDGEFARLEHGPDGQVHAQIVGKPPTPVDFQTAAQVLGGEHAEANLKAAWEQEGIHPAEAVHDAQRDVFTKHDLTTKQEPIKLDPADAEVLTETGGKPASLSAAVTDPPIDIPLKDQPAPPPGSLSGAFQTAGDKLFDLTRDAQRLTTPMAMGTTESMAIAKDFANTVRRNRWEWGRIDDDVMNRFTPEQRERMWNAADEESVMRQSGEASEHMGLATLEPAERAAVEDLQSRAQNAWLRARDLGMVEGEGLPAYTPRMVVNVAGAAGKEGPIPLNGMGDNLRTRTGNMLRRKYLTAEETEAAAKAKYGPEATLARDIRTLPLATAQLEDAIAGRQLINAIKDYGKRTGADTVAEGAIPEGSATKWFTIDHPAFKTWRPKFEEKAGGGVEVLKDAEGNPVFEQVPLYVHGDFEGPLRAVLSQKNGEIYSALISLKAKTMGLIMNSPLIHNLVEWGRAVPAMPGKVLTGRIYFEGNRFKNDAVGMREAIDNGMVPIGGRFFKHSVDDIVSNPSLTPGQSWTAKIASAVLTAERLLPQTDWMAANSAKDALAIKRGIDRMGDFWHNTLLWDRIGDLQAGLYVNFRDEAIAKGIDRTTASRVAAHWANRFAGALPEEAMSSIARKSANVLLFSRSFTLGNLGVLKDMLTGMPKDVLAQIERDGGFPPGAIESGITPGEAAVKHAKSIARRQAIATVAIDMAFAYAGYSLLQNAVNILSGDSTLEKELHGYATRLREALQERQEHPLKALQVFDFLHHVSATSANEAGRQDRLFTGYGKDGTAIYMRVPPGKMGEEFEGYMTGPLDMMRRKLSPLARFGWDVLANDRGFGRKVYDPNADTMPKYIANIGKIAFHLMEVHAPSGQIQAGYDLIKGDGDPKINAMQSLGPIAGVTFSKGAPGGPAVGEMYHAREAHDFEVQSALPDIRKQIQRGDIAGATQRMNELNIPAGLQRFYIRTSVNPSTRLSAKALRDFYLYATPEQRSRMERFRAVSPMAPAEE